jgi:hypothetical protein
METPHFPLFVLAQEVCHVRDYPVMSRLGHDGEHFRVLAAMDVGT